MRKAARLALLASLFLLTLLILQSPASAPAAAPLDSQEQALLLLINQYRSANGLRPLAIDPQLQDAARWMSVDMANKNYFSHTDSLGRDPFQRMAAFGYNYNVAKAENLAAGATSADTAFELWRHSPGHNANILGSELVAVGIGRASNPSSAYGWYWTADFGGYAGSPSTSLLGDVNCSGNIDSTDALLILRIASRLQIAPACGSSSDVNCDGSTGPVDALIVLRYVSGLSAAPDC